MAFASAFIDPVLMAPTPLQILWFLLIGLLIAGYFILDGFDLGSGALYPFIAKTEHEKALVRRSVGPFWDGNEVWLLTGGGALFAAFAPAYATSFSGFYLAIMLVLFGLIARAISVEFRSIGKDLPRFFDAAFFIGSALPALLFGVALGNVIQGLPLDAMGDYAGLPLIGLLRPFPLACGLLGLSIMLLQGACWQALKQPIGSELRDRAAKLRGPLTIIALALFVVSTALYFLICQPQLGLDLQNVLRYLGVVVVLVGVIAAYAFKKKDLASFISVNLIPVGLIVLSAASLFPYLIPSLGPGPSITVASAGGSDLALTAMTIIACIGVPLVLVYHVIIYRTFRGRLKDEDLT
ncbi:MAG: cytochrome d ubiquinol oxidase subunit II [Coriobacteriia bacterium]|nr:cytochrome d ubiquinol oxidase subunit II [Coriobacteriia bacterium]